MIPEKYKGLRALSIRQPWVWLILHAGKDVENRSWRTNYRGRFFIHAALGTTFVEWKIARAFYESLLLDSDAEIGAGAIPHRKDLLRGGIVGIAELIDCVQESDSPWFIGSHGFVLRNVETIDFIPCKGSLGFFTPKAE